MINKKSRKYHHTAGLVHRTAMHVQLMCYDTAVMMMRRAPTRPTRSSPQWAWKS